MPVAPWTRRHLSGNKSLGLNPMLLPTIALPSGGGGGSWSPGIRSNTGLVCDSDHNAHASTPLKLYYVSHGMKQGRLNLHQLKITSSGVLSNCHPESGTKSVKDGLCAGPPKSMCPLAFIAPAPQRWLCDLFGLPLLWEAKVARAVKPRDWGGGRGGRGPGGMVCRPAGEKGPLPRRRVRCLCCILRAGDLC